MKLYIEVSFADPIADGTLTYYLPEKLVVPQLGARVVVAVQRRKVLGFVTAIHTDEPSFKTFPIIEVVDPVSLLSQNMFSLAKEVAHDYVANIGEVLHAMLPAGVKKNISRDITLINLPETIEEKELLWLQEKESASYQKFISLFPAAKNKIHGWLDKNIIKIDYYLVATAKPRYERVLKLTEGLEFDFDKFTEKEKIVLRAFLKEPNPVSANALSRLAKTSVAPINQLKKKNVFYEEKQRVLREVAQEEYYNSSEIAVPDLTEEQQVALDLIKESYRSDIKPVLIRGVTCSGKTEVYLRWVGELLLQNKTAIVLVPEISLTPQMVKRFKDRFGDKVAVLHSRLSLGERFDQWERIRKGELPVVVGARSAVFAPLPNLGTIILDEEGEVSFKQGESPRYHAREVAYKRCEIEKALLVMGSATPTIDSFFLSLPEQGIYRLVEMTKRVSDKSMPLVTVVDMRHELVCKKNRSIFSEALSTSIKETLEKKQQVILYLNRRGYSSFVFCRECGEAIECSRCNVSLVFHDNAKTMRCHYCDETQAVPTECPFCKSRAIKFFGAGTQRVEAEAKRYFPGAVIQRFDSDVTTTKGSLEEILTRFGNKEIDILIGTQMVAKGLDFPDVTLVGIIAADSLLRIADFRASERNFSLLAQVAGRAGRGDVLGRVVLQTYYPEHHSIQCALTEDYHKFYAIESKLRAESLYPPFVHLAAFLITSLDRSRAKELSSLVRLTLLEKFKVDQSLILGPAPAAIEKINERYRFQLLFKSYDYNKLVDICKKLLTLLPKQQHTRVAIDINPFFML